MRSLRQFASLEDLNNRIVECAVCPRLVAYREQLPTRASFRGQEYWRRPVPGFGDPEAWLLVVGLAPAAHGGNRTGRVFTGDESARFLMRSLYRAGFANQPTSESRNDALQLKGCYITAAVKCVPPKNWPTPDEVANCSRYLESEFALLRKLTAVVALGQLAFRSVVNYAKSRGARVASLKFTHGGRYRIAGMPTLYASYHPSPQNTYTGRLTEGMLLSVFRAARQEVRGRLSEPQS